MSGLPIVVFILVAALAAVNGSNDVPKGVATLAGAGVTRYRTAILWGTVTTLVGCVFSLTLAAKMTKLFSTGIFTARPTDAFAVAVLAGAVSWVALATALRLPVSTTHALVGALIGAGLLLSARSVAWSALVQKVAVPLLLSIGVAYVISLALTLAFGHIGRHAPARTAPSDGGPGPLPAPQEDTGAAVAVLEADTATAEADAEPEAPNRALAGAHWVTSGATGFARGLNDTPKIVAVGAFALVPAGMEPWQIMLLVAAAMAAGSLLGGMRVAKRLGEGVVRMNHREGFLANLTTATLVGVGAGSGLPMSTTHVSTGAITGTAGFSLKRLSGRTLRHFLIAWLVTPPFAAVVAALVFIAAR